MNRKIKFKKYKKLTVILLAAAILFANSYSADSLVYAKETQARTETVPDFAPARAAFAKLVQDYAIYGTLTNGDQIPVYSEISSQAEPSNTLASGSQVELTDVVWDNFSLWFKITYSVHDKTYNGYILSDYVITADERLDKWRSEYQLEQIVTSVRRGAAKGAAQANAFPTSYQPFIKKLAKAHPNWIFVPMNTGLNWSDVLRAEMADSRNLVQTSHPNAWKSQNPKDYDAASKKWIIKSGTDWVQASESIIKYYLDPRNFLTEESVFQFEQLVYNKYQKKAGVEKILNGTFMSHKKLEDGSGGKITYAQAFMKIGKSLKVSPYFLASRVRQEQGADGKSPLISGKYPGYKGYYNYFNRSASGVGDEVYRNGLREARANGWNTRYKALKGGAKSTASDYIYKGQDTFYLQKFDVDASHDGLYWHQYMQNLLAADNEGKNVQQSYAQMGILNNRFVFKIPVYKNMPASPCPLPTKNSGSGSENNLAKPTLKKASLVKNKKIKLSWKRDSKANGYYIYRASSKKGKYKKVKTIQKNKTLKWTDSNIKAGKTYYYKIRAYVKTSGKTKNSGYSNVLYVKVPKKN